MCSLPTCLSRGESKDFLAVYHYCFFAGKCFKIAEPLFPYVQCQGFQQKPTTSEFHPLLRKSLPPTFYAKFHMSCYCHYLSIFNTELDARMQEMTFLGFYSRFQDFLVECAPTPSLGKWTFRSIPEVL